METNEIIDSETIYKKHKIGLENQHESLTLSDIPKCSCITLFLRDWMDLEGKHCVVPSFRHPLAGQIDGSEEDSVRSWDL